MKHHWYRFDYHNGSRVETHYVTEDFVERTRTWACRWQIDLVITKQPGT